MAGRCGGSNTTNTLLNPEPETLPIGGGVLPSHRRVFRSQATPGLTSGCLLCSLNGWSQLISEPEIWPRHSPLGAGSWKCAVSAQTDISSKISKIDPSSGPARGRDEPTDPMPFKYKLPGDLTWFLMSPRHQGVTGSSRGVIMPKSRKSESSPWVACPARARPMAHRGGGRTEDFFLSVRLGIRSGLSMGIEIWVHRLTTRGAEIGVPKGGHFGCSK